jgi:hypothetical protein
MAGKEAGVRRFLLQQKYQRTGASPTNAQTASTPLDSHLSAAEQRLRALFTDCEDILFRPLGQWGLAIYCTSLAEGDHTLEHLMTTSSPVDPQALKERLGAQAKAVQSYEPLVAGILSGSTAILVDASPKAWLLQGRQTQARAVSEPQAEISVRGPRDGFVEDRAVNLMLIRRRLRHPALKVQTLYLGRVSQTAVSLVWIEGIAPDPILTEVRTRVGRIDLDLVLEGSTVEEFIEDHPYSPLPTINHTERPDRVTAALAEGRIAILVDGTPFVMMVPALMADFMQTSDDYYQSFYQSTLVRWIRIGGLLVTMMLPGIYVALTAFHQEIMPTPLLLSTASAREGVPMPAVVEALVMQLVFEIVREAAVRMPRQIGSAVTIVGALVIGESAVRAGLISAPMVIVVSLTALSAFILPNYSFTLAFRLISVGLIAMAGTFGLLGILVGEIALLIHLCGLRSFGVPYMQPLSPVKFASWRDVLLRLPLFMLVRRPPWAQNQQRMAKGQQPAPPPGQGGASP